MEGRAAGAVVIGMHALADAQVFGESESAHGVVGQGDEQRVDLARREGGMRECLRARRRSQVHGAEARRFAEAEGCGTDDGGCSALHASASAATNTTTGPASSCTMRACTRRPMGTLSKPSTRLNTRGPSSRSTRTTL